MSLTSVLSDNLRSSRPVKVLERSIEKGRLAHGILLHGENLSALEEVALALSGALLSSSRNIVTHPDLFTLRPSHKARHIRIGETRRLIRDIQHSPYEADRKVALIYEADRMNNAASNAFLKTLEEPPHNTTIFLLSTRPYDLLSTIRSRCFNFRLPAEYTSLDHAEWQAWLRDYRSWLRFLSQRPANARERAEAVISLYGLISRFQSLLTEFSKTSWESEKTALPEGITDEEKDAITSGLRKGSRQQMLCEIELHTRAFTFESAGSEADWPLRQLTRAITDLEHNVRLLEVNLNENVALENFFLNSLRIWSSP